MIRRLREQVLQQNLDRFCFLAFGDNHGPLTCLDRNGGQRFETSLPGIESKQG